MPGNKPYTVQSKEEVRRLNTSTGQPYIAYRIWALTAKGTRFSVEVPEEELDKADAVLAKKAQQLDAI